MNNQMLKPQARPVKVNVTRIMEIFENTDTYRYASSPIIKDYVYSPEKRIIAQIGEEKLGKIRLFADFFIF